LSHFDAHATPAAKAMYRRCHADAARSLICSRAADAATRQLPPPLWLMPQRAPFAMISPQPLIFAAPRYFSSDADSSLIFARHYAARHSFSLSPLDALPPLFCYLPIISPAILSD